MVGIEGFEPSVGDSESPALPLGYTPTFKMGRLMGIEPTNAGTTIRCVNQLRHDRHKASVILAYLRHKVK